MNACKSNQVRKPIPDNPEQFREPTLQALGSTSSSEFSVRHGVQAERQNLLPYRNPLIVGLSTCTEVGAGSALGRRLFLLCLLLWPEVHREDSPKGEEDVQWGKRGKLEPAG